MNICIDKFEINGNMLFYKSVFLFEEDNIDLNNLELIHKTNKHAYFDNGEVYHLIYQKEEKTKHIYGAWNHEKDFLNWLEEPKDIQITEIIMKKFEKDSLIRQKELEIKGNRTYSDILNPLDFKIHNGLILYKNEELITTISESLDNYKFNILKEVDHYFYFLDGILFTIEVIDEYDDRFYFGKWNTLEEVLKWAKIKEDDHAPSIEKI